MYFEGIILLFLLFFVVKCTSEGVRLEYDVCQHSELIFCVNPHEERLAWTFVNNEKEIWNLIENPRGVQPQSNPESFCQENVTSLLFFQATNGQVYVNNFKIEGNYLKFGTWSLVGGKMAFNDGYESSSRDSISVQLVGNSLYVFARSFTNSSLLFVSTLDYSSMLSTPWRIVGGESTPLMTDASVAYNSFTQLLEAFMVSTDGYLYRAWQIKESEWSDWDKTGYSAPKSAHAPVVHAMDTNIFNGRLNVFVHGSDGYLHHIWQTTCDKVPNPWGWCTWSTWNKIGGAIPTTSVDSNTLGIGNNIHLGIEVYVISSEGELYRVWQLDRHQPWSSWERLSSKKQYVLASLPTVVSNIGWWKVFALDTNSAVQKIQQSYIFNVEPNEVGFSSRTLVNWVIPVDEASSKDWIVRFDNAWDHPFSTYATFSEELTFLTPDTNTNVCVSGAIYPTGAGNEDYLDYVYVGGEQNPKSKAVPTGDASFMIYLPEGTYDIRYLVNKQFISAAQTRLTVTSSTKDKEWVQIYKGIFTGLRLANVSVETCVKDGEDIALYFEKAFEQFEDHAVYAGLHDLGVVISRVVKGMADCGIEEVLILKIEGFAKDLIECVKKENCKHFVVDVAKEILVLYENVYEIYGDIRGAKNCFRFKAYAQGGYNIGRVIAACLAAPRHE